VYKYSPANGFSQSDAYLTGIGWLSGGTLTINPGEGVFASCPANGSITFVGTVLQGNLTNKIAAGFNMIGSQVPQTGLLQTQLGFNPNNQDQLYFWSPASQSYATQAAYLTGIGWLSGEPTINVGQAFFLSTGATNNWTRTFTVQ